MKALLLTFGLGLIAALQTQAFPTSEEDQDVSRKWYLKATATNMEIPARKLGPVSVTPITVKTLEDGNLQVKLTILVAGQCQEINTILEHTDTLGKYTAYGGQYVISIMSSPVEDHYILYCEGKVNGQKIQMAKLVGGDPDLNQEALEDFEKVAGLRGLNTENIFIPKQADICSPENN